MGSRRICIELFYRIQETLGHVKKTYLFSIFSYTCSTHSHTAVTLAVEMIYFTTTSHITQYTKSHWINQMHGKVEYLGWCQILKACIYKGKIDFGNITLGVIDIIRNKHGWENCSAWIFSQITKELQTLSDLLETSMGGKHKKVSLLQSLFPFLVYSTNRSLCRLCLRRQQQRWQKQWQRTTMKTPMTKTMMMATQTRTTKTSTTSPSTTTIRAASCLHIQSLNQLPCHQQRPPKKNPEWRNSQAPSPRSLKSPHCLSSPTLWRQTW